MNQIATESDYLKVGSMPTQVIAKVEKHDF